MNVPLLQKIDRYAGVPICFCLTALRRIFDWRTTPGSSPARKILFVKLAEQGSTVLAIPALRQAVRAVGKENVYFVAFQENRFILDLLELIPKENVIAIRTDGFFRMGLGTLKAFLRMNRLKLDSAIDMEFFSRGSAIVTYLSGAKARVGFHAFYGGGPYRGNLMTHRVPYNSRLHTTTTFQILVEALNHDPEDFPVLNFPTPPSTFDVPTFAPKAAEIASVKAMLPANNGERLSLVLLNPNASDLLPLRQWPRERYVELANLVLAELPDVHVVFTGGPNEADEIEALTRQVRSDRCLCLAGKTTLRQLMVLYTLSEILVTNDSGPAHFASLTPIHVITLFGPETPALFSAPPPRNLALWAGLPCSPCVNAFNNRQSTCRDNQCMKSISVRQVMGEVVRIYSERKSVQIKVRRDCAPASF